MCLHSSRLTLTEQSLFSYSEQGEKCKKAPKYFIESKLIKDKVNKIKMSSCVYNVHDTKRILILISIWLLKKTSSIHFIYCVYVSFFKIQLLSIVCIDLAVSGTRNEVFLQRVPPLAPAGPVAHGVREGEFVSPLNATLTILLQTSVPPNKRQMVVTYQRCILLVLLGG